MNKEINDMTTGYLICSSCGAPAGLHTDEKYDYITCTSAHCGKIAFYRKGTFIKEETNTQSISSWGFQPDVNAIKIKIAEIIAKKLYISYTHPNLSDASTDILNAVVEELRK